MKKLLILLGLLSTIRTTGYGQGNLLSPKPVAKAATPTNGKVGPQAASTSLSAEKATVLVNVGHFTGEARGVVGDYLRTNVTANYADAVKVSGAISASNSKQAPITINRGPSGNAALEGYVFGEATAESSGLRVNYDSNPVSWYLQDIAGWWVDHSFYALTLTYRGCNNKNLTSKYDVLACITESYTNAKIRTFEVDLHNNPDWKQAQMIKAVGTAYNFDALHYYDTAFDNFKRITHPDFAGSVYAVQLQSLDEAFFQLAVKNNSTDALFSDERRYINTDPKYQTAAPMFDAANYSDQKKVSFMLVK